MKMIWVVITMATVSVCTVCGYLTGFLPVGSPVRVASVFQVTQVPGRLWLLLVLWTVILLTLAQLCTKNLIVTDHRRVLHAWTVLQIVLVIVLVFNALVLAAEGAADSGAPIPIFHWLFTFIPTVLAALVTRRRGNYQGTRAAFASGILSVPFFALSWTLYLSGVKEEFSLEVVRLVLELGVLPYVIGVALASFIDLVDAKL